MKLDIYHIRCLGHAPQSPREWCARVHDCARHKTIALDTPFDQANAPVSPRLCKSLDFEKFIGSAPRIADACESEGGEI